MPGLNSYDGPTWDAAGIREKRKDFYPDKAEAEALALILSEHNTIQFLVS
jgi:hypothetical protein